MAQKNSMNQRVTPPISMILPKGVRMSSSSPPAWSLVVKSRCWHHQNNTPQPLHLRSVWIENPVYNDNVPQALEFREPFGNTISHQKDASFRQTEFSHASNCSPFTTPCKQRNMYKLRDLHHAPRNSGSTPLHRSKLEFFSRKAARVKRVPWD